MLMFGLALRHGWGCPKNEKNGLHWQANGKGCKKNRKEAAKWYRAAASPPF